MVKLWIYTVNFETMIYYGTNVVLYVPKTMKFLFAMENTVLLYRKL